VLEFDSTVAKQGELDFSVLGSFGLLELLVEFLESQASLLPVSQFPFEGVWLSKTLFLPPL